MLHVVDRCVIFKMPCIPSKFLYCFACVAFTINTRLVVMTTVSACSCLACMGQLFNWRKLCVFDETRGGPVVAEEDHLRQQQLVPG